METCFPNRLDPVAFDIVNNPTDTIDNLSSSKRNIGITSTSTNLLTSIAGYVMGNPDWYLTENYSVLPDFSTHP